MDRRSIRHKTGRRLRRLRVNKGIRTTQELAAEIFKNTGAKIAGALLYSLETGDGECGIDVWIILCIFYRCRLDDIAGGIELRLAKTD